MTCIIIPWPFLGVPDRLDNGETRTGADQPGAPVTGDWCCYIWQQGCRLGSLTSRQAQNQIPGNGFMKTSNATARMTQPKEKKEQTSRTSCGPIDSMRLATRKSQQVGT